MNFIQIEDTPIPTECNFTIIKSSTDLVSVFM